jgi:hypothetical protein
MVSTTVKAASISFSGVASNIATLHWDNGNGDNRIVIASENNTDTRVFNYTIKPVSPAFNPRY